MTPSTLQDAPSLDRFKFVVPQDVYADIKEGDERALTGERHSERGEPKRRSVHVHEVRLAMKGEYPG